LKLDREAARRTAELKREAQLTAQAVRKTGQAARASSSRSGPTLPGVRVVRDGQVVSDLPAEPDQKKSVQERDVRGSRQDIRGPQRDLKVGDRVRLLSFGSVGIINHIRLDEAFLNGVAEVRIIHGHGTGALRKAIAELLADHPHVARFASAPQNQGGSGATIVELRQ